MPSTFSSLLLYSYIYIHTYFPPFVRSGTIDECNASIGLAVALLEEAISSSLLADALVANLKCVQNRLFDLGANLATPRDNTNKSKVKKTEFASEFVDELEAWIDEMDTHLEPLTTFILPGGHPVAATLHVARTIARRAERNITDLVLRESVDAAVFKYVNRLSDFLFVAARYTNFVLQKDDVKWKKYEKVTTSTKTANGNGNKAL